MNTKNIVKETGHSAANLPTRPKLRLFLRNPTTAVITWKASKAHSFEVRVTSGQLGEEKTVIQGLAETTYEIPPEYLLFPRQYFTVRGHNAKGKGEWSNEVLIEGIPAKKETTPPPAPTLPPVAPAPAPAPAAPAPAPAPKSEQKHEHHENNEGMKKPPMNTWSKVWDILKPIIFFSALATILMFSAILLLLVGGFLGYHCSTCSSSHPSSMTAPGSNSIPLVAAPVTPPSASLPIIVDATVYLHEIRLPSEILVVSRKSYPHQQSEQASDSHTKDATCIVGDWIPSAASRAQLAAGATEALEERTIPVHGKKEVLFLKGYTIEVQPPPDTLRAWYDDVEVDFDNPPKKNVHKAVFVNCSQRPQTITFKITPGKRVD